MIILTYITRKICLPLSGRNVFLLEGYHLDLDRNFGIASEDSCGYQNQRKLITVEAVLQQLLNKFIYHMVFLRLFDLFNIKMLLGICKIPFRFGQALSLIYT